MSGEIYNSLIISDRVVDQYHRVCITLSVLIGPFFFCTTLSSLVTGHIIISFVLIVLSNFVRSFVALSSMMVFMVYSNFHAHDIYYIKTRYMHCTI